MNGLAWVPFLGWCGPGEEIAGTARGNEIFASERAAIAGVAPARNGTSWEGHLFGFIAGLGTAWFRYGG